MDESGGGAEGRRNKCLKLKWKNDDEKQDRISALPDSLLHHILSFLPSTKESVQTSILSKRWQNQWTRVPVLIFDFRSGMSSDTNSIEDLEDTNSMEEDFIRFIDNTLLNHDCSKVKKLHLAYDFRKDTNFPSKIRFATRKHVEELILCFSFDIIHLYPLPKFLLPKLLCENASLVKLDMSYCYFKDDWSVNWGSLKAFKFNLKGFCSRDMVANVLSGSPLLEWLELDADGDGNFVIDSKSVRILILVEVDIDDEKYIKISCPNLEEFVLRSRKYDCIFPDKMIENVLSSCPLLHSLELNTCTFVKLVIASKSLKKLVLIHTESFEVEISCPNLEEVTLTSLKIDTLKVMSLPSLICASLDFEIPRIKYYPSAEYFAKPILEQLQNFKELSIGSAFIEILTDAEMGGLSYPWLNNKILTVNDPYFEHLPGIICALRSSPMLEKLVINLRLDQHQGHIFPGIEFDCEEENYLVQYSNKTVFNCSVSNLKTLKIVGLSDRDEKHKFVLNFVEFLLKNARMLEKVVIILADCGTSFLFEVSVKLLSFQRCFPHTTIALLRSN